MRDWLVSQSLSLSVSYPPVQDLSWKTTKWWIVGVVGLAAVLRFHALFANHFHADEALFASWARLIAVWRDPLLQTQGIDKPPLLFYLQAMVYPLFGPVEWVARLPNFVASLLLIPLTAVLAWRISGNRLAGITAALCLALTPLSIQFSATAYIDPLMTTLLVAACVGMARPSNKTVSSIRPLVAGLCFGLAITAKYQAWLFLPLLLALGWSSGWGRSEWKRWLVGFGTPLLILVGWTAARGTEFSLWSQQMSNFGGVRIAWSWELWPRLLAWAKLWYLSLGIPLFVVLTIFIIICVLPGRQRPGYEATPVETGNGDDNDRRIPSLASFRMRRLLARWLQPRALVLFSFTYIFVHWLLAVPVWDRYLLPLMPLVAVAVGCEIGRLSHSNRLFIGGSGAIWQIAVLVGVLQLPVALAARQGVFPIGGQPTADQGAAEIGQYLADAPYGTVLYDHWYSWHWRYHFFDRGVYVSWFPHPQALIEDLQVFATAENGAARYVVLPKSAVARPLIRAVGEAGFRLRPVYEAVAMTLYRVEVGEP